MRNNLPFKLRFYKAQFMGYGGDTRWRVGDIRGIFGESLEDVKSKLILLIENTVYVNNSLNELKTEINYWGPNKDYQNKEFNKTSYYLDFSVTHSNKYRRERVRIIPFKNYSRIKSIRLITDLRLGYSLSRYGHYLCSGIVRPAKINYREDGSIQSWGCPTYYEK
jgi:hypothetical protein